MADYEHRRIALFWFSIRLQIKCASIGVLVFLILDEEPLAK